MDKVCQEKLLRVVSSCSISNREPGFDPAGNLNFAKGMLAPLETPWNCARSKLRGIFDSKVFHVAKVPAYRFGKFDNFASAGKAAGAPAQWYRMPRHFLST